MTDAAGRPVCQAWVQVIGTTAPQDSDTRYTDAAGNFVSTGAGVSCEIGH